METTPKLLARQHFYGRRTYYRGRWYLMFLTGGRGSVPAYVTGTGPVRRASARGPVAMH